MEFYLAPVRVHGKKIYKISLVGWKESLFRKTFIKLPSSKLFLLRGLLFSIYRGFYTFSAKFSSKVEYNNFKSGIRFFNVRMNIQHLRRAVCV